MSENTMTYLPLKNDEDVLILQNLSNQLQFIADLTQSDVFIDCFVPGNDSEAIVVAEAHPTSAKSLYQNPVIGQIALKEKEPGVFSCLESGKSVIGSRGISQENVNIQQNVIPIKNKRNETIGALIMEEDITDRVQQEKNVEVLMETTEQLSETLLMGAVSETKIPSLIHEGLIIYNQEGRITFANDRAHDILRDFVNQHRLLGTNLDTLCFGKFAMKKIDEKGGVLVEEFQRGRLYIQLKAVALHRNERPVGGILLLRDLSEIREKEKQLMIKSAVIKEIHHRVKNNLQTIASLLRLQMRRSSSLEVERVFRESINRIMSISIIHEVLSQDGLDAIDCKEIFGYVSRGIVSSMKRDEQMIEVLIQGDEVFLNSKKASSLALVINELVQNSLNHAFKDRNTGLIQITVSLQEEYVEIIVNDNGVGFTYDQNHRGNLGLEICHTLIEEDLNGEIIFHNTGTGTKVEIAFPFPKGDKGNE